MKGSVQQPTGQFACSTTNGSIRIRSPRRRQAHTPWVAVTSGSFAHLHARYTPMGRTCREASETKESTNARCFRCTALLRAKAIITGTRGIAMMTAPVQLGSQVSDNERETPDDGRQTRGERRRTPDAGRRTGGAGRQATGDSVVHTEAGEHTAKAARAPAVLTARTAAPPAQILGSECGRHD